MIPEIQPDPAALSVAGIVCTAFLAALILAALTIGIVAIRRRNYPLYKAMFWALIAYSLIGGALVFFIMSQPASLAVGFIGLLLALSLGLASTLVNPAKNTERE